MKLMTKLLRDRRGISMTEVVIAMAMVVIVTGAAISVLIASVKSDAKYLAKSNALTGCENAVECVRFAEDIDTLDEALEKVGFVTDEDNEYTYKSGESTVKVTVQTTDNKLESCVVFYNDEEIYTINKQ